MSPRPRKVSDDEIFAALARVMQAVPASELTLAQVGAEAGVTASAVVQRFGSKQQLLRALNARFASGSTDLLTSVRAAATSPLAAIRDYAACFAGMVESRLTVAHHLGYLQIDLTDEEMFAHLRAAYRSARAVLQQWVEEAVASGELRRDVDAAALARVLQTTINGAILMAPFSLEGAPGDWLRAEVDLALRPYLGRPR